MYLVGTIAGDYEYREGALDDHPNIRKVSWKGRVERDFLNIASRNTLGSTLTLFDPGQDVLGDIESIMSDAHVEAAPEHVTDDEREEEFDTLRKDVISRAHEFIKDRIQLLSPGDLEELVAALLRAMGYKARVSSKGPDRGRDVIASPDGLGLTSPRIVSEVKHRKQTMGAPELRSFTGGLREGDRGLYVSVGGFTREAHYEAERSQIPLTLVDLDRLADLVVEYYEAFDVAGRTLVPLMRVYWPVG